MKKFDLFIIPLILLISCHKKEKVLLSADKLYLVEYAFHFMDDYDMQFFVKSFIEVDSAFNVNAFCREDNYYKWYISLTDSMKAGINKVILNHPRDTSFYDEENIRLYSGLYYFLLIEKASGEQVFIDMDTSCKFGELDPLCNQLPGYGEELDKENKKEASQEAYEKVKGLINKLPRWLVTRTLPPPPPKHIIHNPKLYITPPQGRDADFIDYRIFTGYDE